MQDSLRTAGSHLYRLAPLLLELARAFSGAVAGMQGHPGPLALNPASYIRPDGQSLLQPLPLESLPGKLIAWPTITACLPYKPTLTT